MPRRQSIGQLRADFLPGEAAIANIAAPVIADFTGSIPLVPHMRRQGGLATPRSANMADASDVASLTNKQSTGTRDQGPITLTLYRDSDVAQDTVWEGLEEDSYGFLVVRRFGGSATMWAAGDRVEVYPVQVATLSPVDIGENENQQFTLSFAIHDDSDLKAVVAAA